MAYATTTLTGTYLHFDGTPAEGFVEIIPSEPVVKDTTGNTILSGRVKVTLDAAGKFSVDLPATDDTTLNPTGFGYTVAAKLKHHHPPAVSFSLPTGAPVDIEDVTPVDPSTFTPSATYVESGTLATVATSGAYADLSGRPAIPSTAADVGAEPAGLSAETKAAQDAAYAARALVPTDSVHVWGHSYMSGTYAGGYGNPTQTIAPTLADMLGLPLRNEAVGGSQMADSARGWGQVLQKVTRPTVGPGVAGNKFTPPTGLHVIMHGINDLGTYGVANIARFVSALRTAVSRMRAGAIYENSNTNTVSFGGTWSTLTVADRNSGSDIRYTTTVGNTVTITTPKDFPGGTLALGFTSWSDGGAVVSGTVNGITYSIDTNANRAEATGYYVGNVLRIPNVPAGQASYTFTVQSVVGTVGAMFDYWQWEPDGSEGPLVVLIKQPKPLDYAAYTTPPTDADVDTLNGKLDDVAAEFGPRVVTVDTSSIDHDTSAFVAGNIHPTVYGHRVIAGLVVDAIGGRVRYSPAPSRHAPRVEWGTAAPSATTGPTYYVGDRVYNVAPAEAGTAGSMYVTEGWVCTAQGAPGTWVPMRVLTGN